MLAVICSVHYHCFDILLIADSLAPFFHANDRWHKPLPRHPPAPFQPSGSIPVCCSAQIAPNQGLRLRRNAPRIVNAVRRMVQRAMTIVLVLLSAFFLGSSLGTSYVFYAAQPWTRAQPLVADDIGVLNLRLCAYPNWHHCRMALDKGYGILKLMHYSDYCSMS